MGCRCRTGAPVSGNVPDWLARPRASILLAGPGRLPLRRAQPLCGQQMPGWSLPSGAPRRSEAEVILRNVLELLPDRFVDTAAADRGRGSARHARSVQRPRSHLDPESVLD